MPAEEERSDAVILCKNGTFVVKPGSAFVSGKKLKFRIRNMTEFYDADVTLPTSRVAEGVRGYTKQIHPGQSDVFNLAKVNGSFEYQVMVNGERAEGESDPVIIIDPPTP